MYCHINHSTTSSRRFTYRQTNNLTVLSSLFSLICCALVKSQPLLFRISREQYFRRKVMGELLQPSHGFSIFPAALSQRMRRCGTLPLLCLSNSAYISPAKGNRQITTTSISIWLNFMDPNFL